MMIAFILINCDMGNELEEILSLKECCDGVIGTYGIYDFICKVNYDDVNEFEESLKKIRKIRCVTHTITIHTIPEQSEK
jgi:DNA-binding Lrp family transcriptional regulator